MLNVGVEPMSEQRTRGALFNSRSHVWLRLYLAVKVTMGKDHWKPLPE